MNCFLKYLNFAGILALSLLCAGQWKTNSRLNAELTALQKKSDDQATTIVAQAGTIKEDAADIEDYRQRLDTAETELKQLHLDLARTRAERDQLAAERDQLKDLCDKFVAAIKTRDRVLAQQSDAIHQLAAARDEAIKRYNDLVVKYNAVKQ